MWKMMSNFELSNDSASEKRLKESVEKTQNPTGK
jgi:hypothetical protein